MWVTKFQHEINHLSPQLRTTEKAVRERISNNIKLHRELQEWISQHHVMQEGKETRKQKIIREVSRVLDELDNERLADKRTDKWHTVGVTAYQCNSCFRPYAKITNESQECPYCPPTKTDEV
jgi:hypothetical protein